MFFCPQKPNYPERSLSNLGQCRFSPLRPADPLLNVSHPTIKNTLSDPCGCDKRESFTFYLTENQLFLPFSRSGSPLHYCGLYLPSFMPSLFFYPSPFLSFMLSLSLLSWQRTRSKDIHHLLIQTQAKTFALRLSCCLIRRLSISHSWDRVGEFFETDFELLN